MKLACGRTGQLCKAVVALSVFALCCAAAQAQPQPHRPIGRPPAGGPHGRPSAPNIQERWRAMPPGARQNFQRNAERWLRMTPEERNVMRQRENLRRETIRRETEAALRDSGLHLSPQERAQFESRYIQERRKVEQTLRQQIESERQQQLPALIQQLKKEFQIDQPTKGPAAKSVESPKSKK
ncbi:MAG: hypothetical protein DME65_00920 [Verrucomicrobia bacterium]|nr:MAG: hypothetical protein DME65_00920 [Verrucomicrobiota bacterium]